MAHSYRVPSEAVRRVACVLLWTAALTRAASAAERFQVVNFNLRLAATDVTGPDGSTLAPFAGLVKVSEYLKENIKVRRALVGLQEVDELAQRSACQRQAQRLALFLGSGWTGRFSNSHTTTSDRCAVPLAQRGNAILSSAPVEKIQEYHYIFPTDGPQNDRGLFRRSGTSIKIALPGGRKLWFVNTHLDGEGSGQVAMQQIFELLGKVKTFDPDFPVVLVGDLNIKASSSASEFRKHYNRLVGLMSAALFENVFPQNEGVRMHVFVYNPHDVLSVVIAQVLPGVLHRPAGDYIVSDHGVPSVIFDYR